MGMFDWYKPDPARRCPNCFEKLKGWQGKDAGNCLFHWQQHKRTPVDFDSKEFDFAAEVDDARLPDNFDFYTSCEKCDTWMVAEGLCVDGVWRYTFIREPYVPYPSGEEHLIFSLNIWIQDLAERIGKTVDVFEEDGLGTMRAFAMKTNFNASFVLIQSDYQVDPSNGERGFKGPIVYVDGYDAIRFGYEKMYWGIIHALGISEKHVDRDYPSPEKWVDDIRNEFEKKWRHKDQS